MPEAEVIHLVVYCFSCGGLDFQMACNGAIMSMKLHAGVAKIPVLHDAGLLTLQ